MFTIPEQFSSVAKANLEAQLSLITSLTNKAFESVEKVVDLNLNAAKASLEDSSIAARQLLTAKDPQEFFSLSAAQAQPTAAKAIAYGRHLAGIATSAQAEFTRAAEEQIAETGRKVSALVDDVSKNAPAGSENVIAIFKSAIGNANASYEQFSKSTKQAVEVLEANVNSAVSQFTQAAEKTGSRARK
ncbi:phasin family protein [Noviherbaspirillum denitrificans]|uniref:Phasin (PHA-granule associated protein) n=1 Tax=Noviherbaspirillum denitrificans TaxID=1968433 RepID=A0A254THP8_9BURK|nr:phasin family protein [Noviherbaspirillum denitrificans]OWW20093.1 Phasin (PHA-granule associated protein) [Noviherbaspirillum denitrificans]